MVHPYIVIISCVKSSKLDIFNSKPLLTEAYISYAASIINYNYSIVLQSSYLSQGEV